MWFLTSACALSYVGWSTGIFSAHNGVAGGDVCFFSETRIQDSISVVELAAPNISNIFWRASEHEAAWAAGQCGVGLVFNGNT